MFPTKSVQQVAALPFVRMEDGFQVLLITSRRRRRWIVPKGWPKKGLSLPESAAREALQEAGVVGPVDQAPLGTYRYTKRMALGYDVECRVFLYPLLVVEHRLEWAERRQRNRRWRAPGDAARLVDDAGLARILRRLDKDDGALSRSWAAMAALAPDMPSAGETSAKARP